MVIGHQWWWEFQYPELGIVTATDLHLPAGRAVSLEIGSVDVIHSFWVPRLGGKRDATPGSQTRIVLTPDTPGVYHGQCAEFCGASHANMRHVAVVETPEAFGELRPASAHPASLAVPDPVQTEWWTTFRDPMLTYLVEQAVQANLDLVQAEARVRQARAARRIASADLWPQVEASGAYSRNRTSEHGVVSAAAPGRWFNLFQAGFDANWEVDVFGGNRRAVEAAEANVEASIADRDAVLVSLAAEVGLELPVPAVGGVAVVAHGALLRRRPERRDGRPARSSRWRSS